MEESKAQTVKLTNMLQVGWSLPQILLLRACHTYSFLAPYAKGEKTSLIKQLNSSKCITRTLI